MVAKHRRPLWLKVDAYDVHEVPRTVLVHDGDRRFLLHSRVDPSVGGYTPYYAVARLPDEHDGASAWDATERSASPNCRLIGVPAPRAGRAYATITEL